MPQELERQPLHEQEKVDSEQNDSYREYFEENRQVALVEEHLEGNRYRAVFKGVGYIEHEQDEGAFLTDVPGIDFNDLGHEPTTEEIDSWVTKKGEIEDLREMRIDISHLFPYEWMGEGIEYEITVNARRSDS